MFQIVSYFMSEFDLVSFTMWGLITGVVMLVTGLSYRRYLKKNNPVSKY